MALVLADRVQQTGTANTTVSFTLSTTVSGYQSFAVVGNANTTYYGATDTTGNWEVGIGTYATAGTLLTRTTILSSSNSGSAVTFSGTVTVFVTYPSSRSIYADGTTLTATNSSILPIASGGTNSTATATAGGSGYGTGTAHAYTAAGTSGNALISAGAGSPAFGNLALGIANTNVSGTLTVTNGGTGVATLSGIAFGNATSAFTAATGAQISTALGSTNISGNAANVTGTVAVGNGGTGATTLTANGVVYGNGTSAVGVTAAGTTGQVLIATTGSAPSWGTAPAAGVTSLAGTANQITASASTGAVTLSIPSAFTAPGSITATTTVTGTTLLATQPFIVNSKTVTVSYSIPSGSSAMSAGPITVNSGITVTVPSGSKWVVL